MTHVLPQRTWETSTTEGIGSFALSGAPVAGYQTLAAGVGTGNTCHYVIYNRDVTTEYEVGIGTLSAATTLARTSVKFSSNANAAVAFSAGTKDVFCSFGVASSTDILIGRQTAGIGNLEEIACTAAGRALLDDANAAAQRTTLGLGTAATSATGDFEAAGAVATHSALTSGIHGISAFAATILDDANAAAVRATIGAGTGNGDALVANPLSQFAATTSAQLAATISDETGTGALVFANSPTLVTPALGTPASATLTNATGLPISTGVSGLGTGVATFLATPSSANLAAALTDETGTGAAVFANSPTLVTPALGTPASATLTNATGLPISTGVAGLGTGVATFLATPSSANLAAALTDETGTGAAVFATSPTLVTPILGTPTSGTLTNCTGLPVSSGVSGLGTGVATFLATPSSANLAAALTDETGSGANVFATSPTLVTPILGTPTSGTLTNCTGLPLSGLATQADRTVVANLSGATASPSALSTHEGIRPASICRYFRDDWTGASITGDTGSWNNYNASGGGSSITSTQADANHIGIAFHQRGTTAGGINCVSKGNFHFLFGGGVTVYETLVYIDNLSDGTNTYAWRCGFGDIASATASAPGNGIFFEYDSTASANWRIKCAQGGTTTTTTSSTAVVAAAWIKLRIEVNAAGTSANFLVNGSSIGTITTNLPVTSSSNCSCEFYQIAGSVGTTNRIVRWDYVETGTIFTTPR